MNKEFDNFLKEEKLKKLKPLFFALGFGCIFISLSFIGLGVGNPKYLANSSFWAYTLEGEMVWLFLLLFFIGLTFLLASLVLHIRQKWNLKI